MAVVPVRLLISGKMAVGKGTVSAYLVERHGALLMPREQIVKPFVYAVAAGERVFVLGALAELFPGDPQAQTQVLAAIDHFMESYEPEEGKKRRLLQRVIDFVQERDPAAIERALDSRIRALDPPPRFVVIDDVRGLAAFDYFHRHGYRTLRVEADPQVCRARMLARDGLIPPEAAFTHWTETDLDQAPHEFLLRNDNERVAAACAGEIEAMAEHFRVHSPEARADLADYRARIAALLDPLADEPLAAEPFTAV